MGVENNEAVLAVAWDRESIKAVKCWVETLSPEHQSLFAFVPALTNGKETVILAPDGSKKGWSTSNEVKELRDNFIKFLSSGDVWFNWVEVGFGEYGQTILRGNNSNCYSDDNYFIMGDNQ